MFKQLAQIRQEGHGNVTYLFADGTKQVSNINPAIFVDQSTGKRKSLDAVMSIFQSTCWDRRAVKFEF